MENLDWFSRLPTSAKSGGIPGRYVGYNYCGESHLYIPVDKARSAWNEEEG